MTYAERTTRATEARYGVKAMPGAFKKCPPATYSTDPTQPMTPREATAARFRNWHRVQRLAKADAAQPKRGGESIKGRIISRMAAEGATIAAMSKATGIDRSCVRGRMRTMGIYDEWKAKTC